jgi:DNA-binding transcriptional LysR family regulator
MADVELRELQLFLVLAEELHFGRTAERLGLRARERGAGPSLVRVGLLNAASGVTVLNRAIRRFERLHPGGTVRLAAAPFTDRLGPSRRGEVDLAVTRLPLRQPDIELARCSSNTTRAW